MPSNAPQPPAEPAEHPVLRTQPLGWPWATLDPFLFCVHHDDAYPLGDGRLGPAASLAGRDLGQDFAGKDGWRMYHGEHVPGFPQHPHRGFETVTVVRRGLVDHADSLGAAARYGNGDVQWLTAGAGIQHAEMFPLLDDKAPNPLDLFQLWLNLPAADKMAPPHFSMLWAPAIPQVVHRDAQGRTTAVTVVAGELAGQRPPQPPPRSWAARPDSEVAIWTVRMDPAAQWTLPPASRGVNRALYFFRGKQLQVGGQAVGLNQRLELRAHVAATLINGDAEAELLMLQGRPIGEPVAQRGPFVMNRPEEVAQAFYDYQRTRFGGWPWPASDPVHGHDAQRFARHADGRVDRPKVG
jgi:redox-sensitive bicupin YhaK (pirin superfamily)